MTEQQGFEPNDSQPREGTSGCRNAMALLLKVAGVIIMVACGLCTLFFTFEEPSGILMYVYVAGIPFLFGLGFYYTGVWLQR